MLGVSKEGQHGQQAQEKPAREGQPDMTAATEFITELVRAANDVEKTDRA